MKSKKFTKDMTFSEAIEVDPRAAEVLMNRGMMCCGCMMAQIETIEEGALGHGIDVKEILKELNSLVDKDE
jgi:hybrid cluster-associated redox disulfide protein